MDLDRCQGSQVVIKDYTQGKRTSKEWQPSQKEHKESEVDGMLQSIA
jgi:hypothetical protein